MSGSSRPTGGRDVLRLEVGYSLYGSDIDEATTPLEADLAAFVKLDKQFVGKEALLKQQKQPLKRVKVAFKVTSRRTPATVSVSLTENGRSAK